MPLSQQKQEYILNTVELLRAVNDVLDVLVTHEGVPVNSTMDMTDSINYAGNYGQLISKAGQVVQTIEGGSAELKMVRVKTKKYEIIITPDDDVTFMVLQNVIGDGILKK